MTKFQVRAYYGTAQFSTAEFQTLVEALDFAQYKRLAMPAWYKRVQIIRIDEAILHDWPAIPDFSPST